MLEHARKGGAGVQSELDGFLGNAFHVYNDACPIFDAYKANYNGIDLFNRIISEVTYEGHCTSNSWRFKVVMIFMSFAIVNAASYKRVHSHERATTESVVMF
jgi:hypothetical protein